MNFFGHLNTVNKHRIKVIANCFKAGILLQGLKHDLSKYSPTEFLMGIKYYQGTRSPNEKERELFGYSAAWLHHKGRNKHHFEYWVDVNPKTRRYEPVEMPLNYVAEMFCDRVAASKIYMGKNYNDSSALNYYRGGYASEEMHPKTADLLESWLVLLSEKGEKIAFNHIKKQVKEYKKKR